MMIETQVIEVAGDGGERGAKTVAREIDLGWEFVAHFPNRNGSHVLLRRRTFWWHRFFPRSPVRRVPVKGVAIRRYRTQSND